MSKLVNQRLYANLSAPTDVGIYEDSKNTPMTQEEKESGISFHPPYNGFFLFRRETVFGVPSQEESSYRISIAEDGKTAEITYSHPQIVSTEDPAQRPFGTVMHVMVLKCDLSAASPDGQPRVTDMKIMQSFTPQAF